MLGIKIKGEFLDLAPNASLSFELNSPVYLGDDIDVIQGSYSFPFTLPLTSPRNRRLLNMPEVLDNDAVFITDEPCEFWAGGIYLFPGELTVKNATPKEAKVYIVVSTLQVIKDTKLNKLGLPTVTLGSTVEEALAHAKDTALNPEDYDYVFTMFWNQLFQGEVMPEYEENDYQNYWEPTTQEFTNSIAMPFLKLSYVLEKGITNAGFTFSNRFQTNTELRRLLLYNNFSIYDGENWKTEVDLNNHLNKDTKFGEFLKWICRLFCLAPFPDFFDKNIDLRPLSDLLRNTAQKDWTSKASSDYEKSIDDNIPGILRYESAYDDAPTTFYFENDRITWDYEVQNVDDLTLSDPEGFYYEFSTNSIYEFRIISDPDPTIELTLIRRDIPYIDSGINDTAFDSKMKAVFMERRIVTPIGGYIGYFPAAHQKGTLGNPEKPEKLTDRLMFYRGLHLLEDAEFLYPFASNDIYNARKQVVQIDGQDAQYSLMWDRDQGLYNRFWKDWYTVLRNKKDISLKLLLTAKDIRNFNFAEKVIIRNKEYFVKRLRITFTHKGIQPVDADLVSLM